MGRKQEHCLWLGHEECPTERNLREGTSMGSLTSLVCITRMYNGSRGSPKPVNESTVRLGRELNRSRKFDRLKQTSTRLSVVSEVKSVGYIYMHLPGLDIWFRLGALGKRGVRFGTLSGRPVTG